jgi:quercetin dioxygenase-like cupin family protein
MIMPRTSSSFACFITALGLGLTACDQSTSPPVSPSSDATNVDRPSLTMSVGNVTTQLARANIGQLNWQSNFEHFTIQLLSHDDTDVGVATQVMSPGGTSGWHSHFGPVLVLVKSGAVKSYHGDDPTCPGTNYSAGEMFIEGTDAHIVRNEGAVTAETVVVFFVPVGASRRIDQPAPGNCPF